MVYFVYLLAAIGATGNARQLIRFGIDGVALCPYMRRSTS
jgi:hypothetical protein